MPLALTAEGLWPESTPYMYHLGSPTDLGGEFVTNGISLSQATEIPTAGSEQSMQDILIFPSHASPTSSKLEMVSR